MHNLAEAHATNAGDDQAFNEGKFLTFVLSNESYGISITKVREIIGMMPVTRVPQSCGFIKGVINLRGKVIPVIDLRRRFGMAETDDTNRTCIIVVEIDAQGGGNVQMGIVVDSVSEVLNIPGDDIEEPPGFGAGANTSYIMGLAKIDASVKILIDIDRVLGHEDARNLMRAVQE